MPSPFRPNESVPFDEFSFTVVLTYNGPQIPGDPSSSEVCRSAAFEYMRLTGKQDEMGDLSGWVHSCLWSSSHALAAGFGR